MRVNLRWQPPSAAHSSPMAVSIIDRHVYNHMTLNNVHCLEWLHFYCCTCLTTWKIDLLHLLEFYFIILVKFFWMDRRLYKQPRRELKTMKTNSCTRTYIRTVAHVCIAREHLGSCYVRTWTNAREYFTLVQ